jgi:AraC family transcriptional regulator of adaptative response / DNA-3-methyladenine glycosylase II
VREHAGWLHEAHRHRRVLPGRREPGSADGVCEREGVEGLSRRLGYSTRHLTRLLTDQLGAGPQALARARRAQQARALIESTALPMTEVAFAAGFSSVRQFNDTIRQVYDATPSDFRRGRSRGAAGSPGPLRVDLRVPVRSPFDAGALREFLAAHVVTGVEAVEGTSYVRSLLLPHGPATVRLDLREGVAGTAAAHLVPCLVTVTDLRDIAAATERCRRVLDADCDPVAVDEALAADEVLAPLVLRHPGLRVPGHVDRDELALRTVLGQQVSLSAANRLGSDLVRRLGERLPEELVEGTVDRLFPTAAAVAGSDTEELPMPRSRAEALVGLASALADGSVILDRGADRAETSAALLRVRGIGPWTAGYVAARALGDPDVFLVTDAAVLRALRALDVEDVLGRSESWRPWRSYALLHLWTTVLERAAVPGEDL